MMDSLQNSEVGAQVNADSLSAMVAEAKHLLQTVFGYQEFRLNQQAIITDICRGKDTLALMPTGGGKSLCYQIPAMIRAGTGIVVSPLIALMEDQVNALRLLGVKAAGLNSSMDWEEQRATEQALRSNALDILYVAPERLLTGRFLELLKTLDIALFAIDEAHCVSQWGHDFRKDYQQLSQIKRNFPATPIIALTATADSRTRKEIIDNLCLHQASCYVSSFDRPNIHYTVYSGENPRAELLRFIEKHYPTETGIVYCLTRKKVETVAQWLSDHGRTALPYHAGLSDAERKRNHYRFVNEDGVVIVATIAFGMGIDKPDVRFVAHLNMPKCLESYYQETGRAGRDGYAAQTWMGFGMDDVALLRQMLRDTDANELYKRASQQKLDAMLGFCEMTTCRRQALLAYFGELQPEPCGNCDNCLAPPETIDASVSVQMALSCIYRTEQRFGVSYLIDVLLGKETDRILQNQHHKLSTFAIGKQLRNNDWRDLFRQLLMHGIVVADQEAYGAIKLTEKCRPFLRGEQKFFSRKQKPQPLKPVPTRSLATEEYKDIDQDLLQKLKTLRSEFARESGVPAYVVFHDKTLVAMAASRPRHINGLRGLHGIGEKKLQLYGQAFLDTIIAHTSKNGVRDHFPPLFINASTDEVKNDL